MSHLLIKCKRCKAIVDTGVSMDLEPFCSLELENNSSVCHRKICGEKLLWRKDGCIPEGFKC